MDECTLPDLDFRSSVSRTRCRREGRGVRSDADSIRAGDRDYPDGRYVGRNHRFVSLDFGNARWRSNGTIRCDARQQTGSSRSDPTHGVTRWRNAITQKGYALLLRYWCWSGWWW